MRFASTAMPYAAPSTTAPAGFGQPPFAPGARRRRGGWGAAPPACRTSVVATHARGACQWTCSWTWVSIATAPIGLRVVRTGFRRDHRLKVEDRPRLTAVDDRAIGGGA